MRRRTFLKAGSCCALFQGARSFAFAGGLNLPGLAAVVAGLPSAGLPIIDAHIHLFDTSRPGGVPWPDPSDAVLYKPALPSRYKSMAESFGVVGAIAVECSPLVEDNDWLLRAAALDPIIVGTIGDLDPASPGFPRLLERYAANPLFRGIRYGNLWGRDLGAHLSNSEFIGNLKRLAAAGLVLESANPNPVLIADILKLTDRVPELRTVIDHLPQAPPPAVPAVRKSYEQDLRSLSQRNNVFVKGSEVLRQVNGKVPEALDFYTPWLDEIWEIFGADRMLFGSDWPNSDHLAPYAATFDIIWRYMVHKGRPAQENFFWKNSAKVYRWHKRSAGQPQMHSAQLIAR